MIWPEARFREAFHEVYIPGLYTSRVKRPGMRYIYRSIISDEFCDLGAGQHPAGDPAGLHILGWRCSAVSFWAIYETGYVDNDLIGARHEKDPNLTRQFFESPVADLRRAAWVWAAGCGALALLLLRWPLCTRRLRISWPGPLSCC